MSTLTIHLRLYVFKILICMLNFTYIIYYSIEKIILVDFSNFNKKKIKIELYVYDVLKIVRMIMINVF